LNGSGGAARLRCAHAQRPGSLGIFSCKSRERIGRTEDDAVVRRTANGVGRLIVKPYEYAVGTSTVFVIYANLCARRADKRDLQLVDTHIAYIYPWQVNIAYGTREGYKNLRLPCRCRTCARYGHRHIGSGEGITDCIDCMKNKRLTPRPLPALVARPHPPVVQLIGCKKQSR